MSEAPELLSVRDLRVETHDGKEIIAEVCLEISAGEVLALVGESGCGKTTTAYALLAHERPGTKITAGQVMFDGLDLLTLSGDEIRRLRGSRIAYVPQDPTSGLNPRHRVGKQIEETLIVHGVGGASARAAARGLAERVGLPGDEEFLARYPFELSGGQQQRVAIAMALACTPAVVVLDEPTTGLDVTTQARVLELLRELGSETGAAFVYVTHDLAVVDGLAGRVAVMYAGRVIEVGPREDVFRRPSHPYTRLLLSSVPRLSVRTHLRGIEGTAPPPGHRPDGCSFAPRCPLAVERCLAEFPRPTKTGGHEVRCWRAGDDVPGAETPSVDVAAVGVRETLLAAESIVASYGKGAGRRAVLHGVSFELAPGECLALVGESGSGKTTLGRCVAGLHEPDSGFIALAGEQLAPAVTQRTAGQRQAVQIVFQNPDRSLNPSQTAGDAIGRPLRLFGFADRSTAGERVAELFDRVHLPRRLADRYPRELSGGEKQRVAIARALAARPAVLICDEVTSALDVSIQAEIVVLLQELQRDGLALLFITHNLALVNSIAQRVLVLERGEAREYGTTERVIGDPQDAYTRDLIAAAPELASA